MSADEMREIAGMLYDLLANRSSTLDELKYHVKDMADCLEADADDLENEDE